ncbi:MAG: hypothetical protein PHX62_04915 [Bacilli bacterium]|nr:hypothetical protein [Bacilli bacterium]
MNGIELVTQEREEQVHKHGFDKEHDSQHSVGELTNAALFLLTEDSSYYPKHWQFKYYEKFKNKIDNKDKIEILKVAAAMLVAEIDLINQINDDKPF